MTAVRMIACPSCGGSLEVRAAGFSVNLACRYCGSLLDVSRPEVGLIEAHARAAAGFKLPLGRRGTLMGTEWETVGALRRSDASYAWEEHLLFNPYAGYRWLVLSEGEWQFGTMLLDRPEGDGYGRTVTRGGLSFTWDGEGDPEPERTVTDEVLGEFYWRVRQGDEVFALMFERGEQALSREEGAGEANWTLLVPIDTATVEAAFALKDAAKPQPQAKPRRRAAPRADPLPRREVDDLPAMFGLAFAAMVALLLAMVLISGPVDRAAGTIDAPFGSTREGVKIGTIAVKRPWQFVSVIARAKDFDNRWVDLDYSLVDRATGQSIDGYGIVEHYSGTDSDGRWSEGRRTSRTKLGRVARGTYDVYVDAAAHGWPADPPTVAGSWSIPETITVSIEAETGALPWGNWWTASLLLLLFPCIVTWRRFREMMP
ncbi:DUF4178 domain-containing protein [Novosphingobium sp. BL-52-GroH]|uniref:DUF4178 domain-containing protein n=1 Tax=Novosphingobium sp. BL-52-GroH TaxID=3349877 RepID=UPI00384DAF0C